MGEMRRVVDNIDDIPEPLQQFYTEREGKWVLMVEPGDGEKAADDVRRALSARDNERAEAAKLRKQIEELQSKFGGIDPEQLPEAMKALQDRDELEQQRLIAEKRFEEAAERKFQRQIAEMKRQVDTLTQSLEQQKEEYQGLFGQYGQVRINEALSREFIEAGIDPDFLDAAVQMEARRWEIDPQSKMPVPVEYIDNGQTKVTAMGSDGNPLTMKEHTRIFLRDKPKWALSSNGSNASHQSGSALGNQFQISETDARDFNKYMSVRNRAEKAGAEVQIVQG